MEIHLFTRRIDRRRGSRPKTVAQSGDIIIDDCTRRQRALKAPTWGSSGQLLVLITLLVWILITSIFNLGVMKNTGYALKPSIPPSARYLLADECHEPAWKHGYDAEYSDYRSIIGGHQLL